MSKQTEIFTEREHKIRRHIVAALRKNEYLKTSANELFPKCFEMREVLNMLKNMVATGELLFVYEKHDGFYGHFLKIGDLGSEL